MISINYPLQPAMMLAGTMGLVLQPPLTDHVQFGGGKHAGLVETLVEEADANSTELTSTNP